MARKSGLLLHITSLPSPYGIGDLGPSAYGFADFLAAAGQGFWQIVPLNPTTQALGDNPYSSPSAFAGNTLLISPDVLVKESLLSSDDLKSKPSFPEDYCDYAKVTSFKEGLLNKAFECFKKDRARYSEGYEKFCSENSAWLEDYALYVVIKTSCGGRVWNEWPVKLRNREPKALDIFKSQHDEELERVKFLQYLFFKQWFALKRYCNDKGIQIIGDIPIYVSYDSVDVWVNHEIFKLDEEMRPTFVSGVPPDYFSATGQLWGNPVYRWDVLKKKGYKWWIDRMRQNFGLVDILRVDHFRGFVAFWEVPAGEKTAINGQWIKAPVIDFFETLLKTFSGLPIIAEDLGIITEDVKEVMHQFGFPGMKVLLFAFGEDNPEHPYLPHNFVRNCVVYTGTHDNNTVVGWFDGEATADEKKRLFRYLGREVSRKEVSWELIRAAMMSISNATVFPVQDVLGLGKEARMNTPSTCEGNYRWRLLPGKLTPDLSKKLLDMTTTYGRAPKSGRKS